MISDELSDKISKELMSVVEAYDESKTENREMEIRMTIYDPPPDNPTTYWVAFDIMPLPDQQPFRLNINRLLVLKNFTKRSVMVHSALEDHRIPTVRFTGLRSGFLVTCDFILQPLHQKV